MDPKHPHAPHPVPGRRLSLAQPKLERDPVCGMMVPADAALRADHAGKTYVFCNPRCRERFTENPGRYLAPDATPNAHPHPHAHEHPAPDASPAPAPAPAPTSASALAPEWTCPM